MYISHTNNIVKSPLYHKSIVKRHQLTPCTSTVQDLDTATSNVGLSQEHVSNLTPSIIQTMTRTQAGMVHSSCG